MAVISLSVMTMARSHRRESRKTAAHTPSLSIDVLIVTARGQRVIAAADLARIYGVETRVLNQAVKRNLDRFPSDFAFRLTAVETRVSLPSRSQSVILKRGQNVKYPPLVFTEHGAMMAANVLNSHRAVQMSVFVVRAFLRLRDCLRSESGLTAKLQELEHRVSAHDAELRAIVLAIRRLITPPAGPTRRIGYPTSGGL